MTLHLVIDPTSRPALFGREAAVAARRLGPRFMHLPAAFDLAAHPDAAQYVHAKGGLGPSGLYFAERILGHPVEAASSVAEILAAARHGDVAVPIHAAFGQDDAALRTAAAQAAIAVREQIAPPPSSPASDDAVRHADGAALTICLLGRESDHRHVYPAALASLEDAAGVLGINIAVRFVNPREPGSSLFDSAAGVLLPGGSEMGNVLGLIRAAHYAIERRLPILGLCLGMQTMATAFAQKAMGDGMVNLAEADPTAPIKSFVAMASADAHGDRLAPLPEHRTGDAAIDLVSESQLAAIMGAPVMAVRCNHRYHLSPALRPKLEAAGLVVSATSFEGRVADAVEWPAHPFFVGLQGHPELSAAPGAAHPVLLAFLESARDQTRDGRDSPHSTR